MSSQSWKGVEAEVSLLRPFEEIEPSLDEGIKEAVRILRAGGIHTIESCEGGEGHAYPEPVVVLAGAPEIGFLAYGIAAYYGLPVSGIRRCWRVYAQALEGPYWEITFLHKIPSRKVVDSNASE